MLFSSLVSRVCVRARDAVCFIHEIIRETGDRTEEKSFFFLCFFLVFRIFFSSYFFLASSCVYINIQTLLFLTTILGIFLRIFPFWVVTLSSCSFSVARKKYEQK